MVSEYGLKIKNFEAASIYEYQNGFRSYLNETDAMLTNSLFLDFLYENGLNVWKGESTRDVICLQFSYGTKGLEDMIEKVDEMLNGAIEENAINYFEDLRQHILDNSDKCIQIKKEELRKLYYKDGVDITYKTYNRNGKIIKSETIHYKMLYRTPGKAKKGTCMFIREELYDAAHNFLYMGIELPKENPPIVEIGAYSSLITSSIVGKVQIKPEEILILKDYDSFLQLRLH